MALFLFPGYSEFIASVLFPTKGFTKISHLTEFFFVFYMLFALTLTAIILYYSSACALEIFKSTGSSLRLLANYNGKFLIVPTTHWHSPQNS